MATGYVVVIDYGLGGADILPRVFASEDEATAAAESDVDEIPTGYQGWEVVEVEDARGRPGDHLRP